MARDSVRRRFRDALIGTYKHLILGANSAVSDFRDWLLHACTGSRYKFLRRGARRAVEGIHVDARKRFSAAPAGRTDRVSFEPNSLTTTLNHRCGETYLN